MQLRWAKVWTDILRSPPLRRAIRQQGAEVGWVWVTCILLAAQCGRGGDLVGDDGVALTDEDIADAAGVTVTRTVTALVTLESLGWCVTGTDGVRSLPAFMERQESPSAARMRRKRAKDNDPTRHSDAHSDVTSRVTVTHDVTVEAEAEAEAENKSKDALSSGTSKPAKKRSQKSKPTLPEWIPAVEWEGFVDHRRKMRKPLSERAVQLLVGKLDRLRGEGHDPGELLDTAVERGWQTVYAPDGGAPASRSESARHTEPVAPRPPIVTAQPRRDCAPPPADLWSWDGDGDGDQPGGAA